MNFPAGIIKRSGYPPRTGGNPAWSGGATGIEGSAGAAESESPNRRQPEFCANPKLDVRRAPVKITNAAEPKPFVTLMAAILNCGLLRIRLHP
jgi:hypothetical protein